MWTTTAASLVDGGRGKTSSFGIPQPRVLSPNPAPHRPPRSYIRDCISRTAATSAGESARRAAFSRKTIGGHPASMFNAPGTAARLYS